MNDGSTRLPDNIVDVEIVDILSMVQEINENALLQAQAASQQLVVSTNPVKRDLLKALPTYFIIKTKDLSANKVVQPCNICLENYRCRQHCQKLPCGHTFHKVCINKWFTKYNRTCPVCRKDPFIAES